jgi:hypothetical protein
MGADIADRANALLKEHLIAGELSYNYKLLSRELAIHVNDAKRILYGFHKKHKDLLDASYIIVGYVDRGEIEEKVIKRTVDLEADKARFTKIESMQVYSITLKNIKIDEVLVDVNERIRSYNNTDAGKLETWGVIKGPALVVANETNSIPLTATDPTPTTTRPVVSKPTTSLQQSSKKTGTPAEKKKKEPDMGLLSERILARNKQNTTELKKKKPTQQTIGRSFTAEPKKPATDQSRRRTKTEPVAETVEDAGLNDEEYSKKKRAEKDAKDKKQKELESMFDDDDDDDFMEISDPKADEVEKEEEQQQQQPTVKESPQKKPLEDLEDIFDSSFSQTQTQHSQINNTAEEKDSQQPAQEETKSSYYDEDGYLVTKVEKPQTKPKPAAKRAAKTSSQSPTTTTTTTTTTPPSKKAKTGPKQQSSLMNFFGKK